MKAKILIFLLISFSNIFYAEEESWVLDDIRITGLQRVSAGSVFAVMPVGIGDIITQGSRNYWNFFKSLGNRLKS